MTKELAEALRLLRLCEVTMDDLDACPAPPDSNCDGHVTDDACDHALYQVRNFLHRGNRKGDRNNERS